MCFILSTKTIKIDASTDSFLTVRSKTVIVAAAAKNQSVNRMFAAFYLDARQRFNQARAVSVNEQRLAFVWKLPRSS